MGFENGAKQPDMTQGRLLPRPLFLRDFGSEMAIERLFIVRLIEYGGCDE
ncbi:hypothetical protein LCGC14_3072170 [marine sediment metagenome]|uniref:Uncharacterized protein n=1 Tax=marine sediment metagenome TaxID=412755 RepID=A0A0F8Z6D5_9ZZZZ